MLLDSVDVNHLGVLCLVGMVGSVVDMDVLDELASETVLGEHSFEDMEIEGVHTRFEVLVKRLLHQSLGSLLTLAAGVTGVAEVDFVGHLVAGHDNLVGVDDDDVVAAGYMGGVAGLVFAAEDFSHLGAESAEHLVGGVDDNPFLLDAPGIWGKGFVT